MNRISIVLLLIFLFVNAYSQTVDFTFESTNGLYCSPSTIKFTQTCTGSPISFIWDFGNGQNGYGGNETLTYNSAGTFTVKLIANFNNIILQISKTIKINPAIKPVIMVDRDYICMPGIINFTGTGNGSISNYQWNFGDGTVLVNTSSANTNHAFANFGTDTVTLRATDIEGCYGDTNIVVSIRTPSITATVTPSTGCVPANVSFSGSVEVPLNSPVSNYTWDFGDGSTPRVTTVNNTNYAYSLAGTYLPKLMITTSEGCTGTYNFEMVSYGSPPANTVAYSKKSIICGSEAALLVAKGTNANRYFWNFGDGTTLSTTDTIVAHKYTTLGPKSVGVTAYESGCPGLFTRTAVTVIGVISQYASANNCADKHIYSFADTSQGNVSSNLWNFGDGVQQANINMPVHSYPLNGQFLSSLIVNDNITGCADTATRMIYTAIPVLNSSGSSVCKNDSVTFSIKDNYTDTAITYTWNVLGSQIAQDSNAVITINANTLGNYNNFVVINRDPGLCPDTVRSIIAIDVKGPNLNFNAPANICFENTIAITNNSQPFIASDTVRLWYWNYGNNVQNDSVFQPSPFQYAIPDEYNVTLTAIDKNGCKDTLTKIINVNPTPFLRILPKTDTICTGQPITMIALNNDNVVWSPGNNLSCTNCDTTVARPPVSSKFYVTVTNAFNCRFQDSNYIEVYMPFTAAPISGNVNICSYEGTTLDANPKGKKILWSPVTQLSDPTVYNPIAKPLESTVYTATLTDSLGCFSSSTAFNVFVDPLPIADAGPDKFYPKGTNFTFTPTYSNNISTYSWTPSDLLSCGNCAIPNGLASYTQKYILKVISDSGCVASDSVTINIECKRADLYMPKAFSPNNDNLNDFYYPLTKSFTSIAEFTIYNRQGQVVYAARNFPPNDRSFGWDGRFKGKDQTADTYVYTLGAICEIGEKVYIHGSFVLFR